MQMWQQEMINRLDKRISDMILHKSIENTMKTIQFTLQDWMIKNVPQAEDQHTITLTSDIL